MYICISMWEKTIHIALMVLVYLSSTSLMISKHFCSDELMGTSFMTEAESCHSDESAPLPCPNHPVDQKDKKDCCSNEFQLVKTELNHDLYKPEVKTFQFSELLPVLVYVFLENNVLDPEHIDGFITNWDPPSTSAVYLSRIQQFLC